MAVCLDSLGMGNKIHMHVSKPPKEGTTAHNFLTNLKVKAAFKIKILYQVYRII